MNIILSFIYNEISIKKYKHIENGVKNIMNEFKIGGIYTSNDELLRLTLALLKTFDKSNIVIHKTLFCS